MLDYDGFFQAFFFAIYRWGKSSKNFVKCGFGIFELSVLKKIPLFWQKFSQFCLKFLSFCNFFFFLWHFLFKKWHFLTKIVDFLNILVKMSFLGNFWKIWESKNFVKRGFAIFSQFCKKLELSFGKKFAKNAVIRELLENMRI